MILYLIVYPPVSIEAMQCPHVIENKISNNYAGCTGGRPADQGLLTTCRVSWLDGNTDITSILVTWFWLHVTDSVDGRSKGKVMLSSKYVRLCNYKAILLTLLSLLGLLEIMNKYCEFSFDVQLKNRFTLLEKKNCLKIKLWEKFLNLKYICTSAFIIILYVQEVLSHPQSTIAITKWTRLFVRAVLPKKHLAFKYLEITNKKHYNNIVNVD